jgi:hypothetical protein
MTAEEATLRMRRLGFEPAGEPETVAAAAGEHVTLHRTIPAGDCAVFAALGSRGIDALALRLRRDGELLAADTAGRPTAWVAHCAEEDTQARLELTMPAGSGSVSIVAFRALRAEVADWAGPPLQVAAAAKDPAAPGRDLARRLETAGYDPGRVVFEAERAAAGEGRRIDIGLAAGECGMLVADAGREPALLWACAGDAGTVSLDPAIVAGDGPVRVVFHALPRVELPRALDDPPLAIREAAAIFMRHGMTVAPDPPVPTALPGAGWSARFEARPGRCYGFAAARRDTAPIESFRLADAAGRELARWTGPASPALLVRCVHGAPGELVLEISESGGAGDAPREPPLIVVFVSEASAAAPFLDSP